VNVQAAFGYIDLLPLQVTDLRGPQAVPIGDQDHGRVAMPVAAVLACAVHQPLDVALGEIAPFDCQVFGVSAPRLINSLLTVRSGTTRALCRTMSKSLRLGLALGNPNHLADGPLDRATSDCLQKHSFAAQFEIARRGISMV
jgi:hypothetical protein